MSEELYVGYLEHGPLATMRFVRARVRLAILGSMLVAAVLAASQPRFAKAFFEYGNTRTIDGWLQAEPYPTLVVRRPGTADSWSRYLLTSFGKFGAPEELAAWAGRKVRLTGTLVFRDDQTMLELSGDAPAELAADPDEIPPSSLPTADLGRRVLSGEIVDSKCFLGVMKPGHLETHRACAVRCISGGVPPILLVRDERGSPTYYLLADAEGRPVGRRLLDRIAEPVEVSGRVLVFGDRLLLLAAPEAIRPR